MNSIKAQFLPLKISLLVMFGSLIVFLFGPIPWIENDNFIAYFVIVLLILYFLAFTLGYCARTPKSGGIIINHQIIEYNEGKILNMLKYTLFINLIFSILLALIYSDTTSISGLINKMMQGLFAPSEAYYLKDTSSRSESIIVWLSLLYSPWLYITKVLGLYYFNELKLYQKILYILAIIVEVMRWLAVGTNKGLFDIVVLLLFYYILLRMKLLSDDEEHTYKLKKTLRRILLVVAISATAFLIFFGTAISARVGGVYHEEYFNTFPYNQLPDGLKFFVEKFDSYLTQGYKNFILIVQNCEFKWTFGIGNSRFLMQIFNSLFGIDLTSRTYPYQLTSLGVDPLASWHTAYGWFASDFTIIGIIPFMFLVAYYTSGLTKEVIANRDPISMTLLYMMILSIVNASCTNYILAYSGSFVPFIILHLLRWCRKHTVVIGKFRL